MCLFALAYTCLIKYVPWEWAGLTREHETERKAVRDRKKQWLFYERQTQAMCEPLSRAGIK